MQVGEKPCVWPDASYLKLRHGGRNLQVAAPIAVEVNADGRREIIGIRWSIRSRYLDRVPAQSEGAGAGRLESGDLVRRANDPTGALCRLASPQAVLQALDPCEPNGAIEIWGTLPTGTTAGQGCRR